MKLVLALFTLIGALLAGQLCCPGSALASDPPREAYDAEAAADGDVTELPDENPSSADLPPAQGETMTTRVVLETTKGDIVLEVHPDWSPIGAAHFIELVNAGFYDGAPWFRVLDGFVAQCGIAADPALNEEWSDETIKDEPVVQGNKPGFVAFGKSGLPDSRSTHIFINYGDNSYGLDGQGFSCFAEVVEGMDVAKKLYRAEYNDQGGLAGPGGMERFRQKFPQADYINKAHVQE